MLPLYLRLDGMVIATQPTEDGDWIQIEEAARIIREHNERKAREAQEEEMGAGMYPSDQLEQLPEPCIPCRLNRDMTEAARRIVDLEEERDALKAPLNNAERTAERERGISMEIADGNESARELIGMVEDLRSRLATLEQALADRGAVAPGSCRGCRKVGRCGQDDWNSRQCSAHFQGDQP